MSGILDKPQVRLGYKNMLNRHKPDLRQIVTAPRTGKNPFFLSFCPGCSIEEALEAASLHPAQLLGISHRKGKLDYGSDAGQEKTD